MFSVLFFCTRFEQSHLICLQYAQKYFCFYLYVLWQDKILEECNMYTSSIPRLFRLRKHFAYTLTYNRQHTLSQYFIPDSKFYKTDSKFYLNIYTVDITCFLSCHTVQLEIEASRMIKQAYSNQHLNIASFVLFLLLYRGTSDF